ncbi:hypothetical protein Tsubulata_030377 [Turnera subulata]|uniref:F-box domain-containing protein n=1 Tax=Turnera subulata TaxID=218843 RepID=A0A9Q0FRG1_9ROSI|nr:hypothetical protein Tsubulata_030377 [Turnera subulata]
MAAVHPEPINHLALTLSQRLDLLKSSATSISSATADAASAVAATTTTARDFNDLPDDVLLHILGYLPSTKEAIQASLISRRWRNLWLHLPNLLFPKTNNLKTGTEKTLRASATFIHRALALRSPHPPQIQKFYIQYQSSYDYPLPSSIERMRDMESWVYYAIHHDVQELDLDLSAFRYCYYHFYSGIFMLTRIKCLTSLRLQGFRFSGLDVSDLLSCCENLESFSLGDIYELSSRDSVIKIHSLKLKKLNLGFYCNRTQSLEIDCPNLTSLVMTHFVVREVHFKDVSSLDSATVYFWHQYYEQWESVVKSLVHHVKHLGTRNWGLQAPSKHGLLESLVCNLKHLEIRTGYSKFEVLDLASFLQLFPNLESLVLESPSDDFRNKRHYRVPDYRYPQLEASEWKAILEQPIHLQLPSLKLVKIKDFRQTTQEVIFLSYLLLHGHALEKIVLDRPEEKGNFTVQPIVLRRKPKKMRVKDGDMKKFELSVRNSEIIIFVRN